MKELTPRQAEILRFLVKKTREQGYPPTFREIGDAFGIASTNGVMKNLAALERKGYIRRKDRASRAIEIHGGLHDAEDAEASPTALRLEGRIAAGQPIQAVANPDTIDMASMFARDACFVLEVRGDSMIEDSILDGDYVIVERRDTAQNGDTVVALVGEEEATLKRFYREKDGRIRLQPANSAMAPIYPERVAVQGIVLGVLRRYR